MLMATSFEAKLQLNQSAWLAIQFSHSNRISLTAAAQQVKRTLESHFFSLTTTLIYKDLVSKKAHLKRSLEQVSISSIRTDKLNASSNWNSKMKTMGRLCALAMLPTLKMLSPPLPPLSFGALTGQQQAIIQQTNRRRQIHPFSS